MEAYQHQLREHGIEQSMSRKGNCLDNAVMENFFGHLKAELYYLQRFDNVEHLAKEIEHYIDYYNHDRLREAKRPESGRVSNSGHEGRLNLHRPTYGAQFIWRPWFISCRPRP